MKGIVVAIRNETDTMLEAAVAMTYDEIAMRDKDDKMEKMEGKQ